MIKWFLHELAELMSSQRVLCHLQLQHNQDKGVGVHGDICKDNESGGWWVLQLKKLGQGTFPVVIKFYILLAEPCWQTSANDSRKIFITELDWLWNPNVHDLACSQEAVATAIP